MTLRILARSVEFIRGSSESALREIIIRCCPLRNSGISGYVKTTFTRCFEGLTSSVHQRPLTMAPAAVWCNAG
jgi:hypothetical protein